MLNLFQPLTQEVSMLNFDPETSSGRRLYSKGYLITDTEKKLEFISNPNPKGIHRSFRISTHSRNGACSPVG